MTSRPRRSRRRRVAGCAAELVVSLVLGVAAVAVADTDATTANARLIIAVTFIVAVVLAEWGLRHAVHKVRHRDNPSSARQARDLSNDGQNRRSRRG